MFFGGSFAEVTSAVVDEEGVFCLELAKREGRPDGDVRRIEDGEGPVVFMARTWGDLEDYVGKWCVSRAFGYLHGEDRMQARIDAVLEAREPDLLMGPYPRR